MFAVFKNVCKTLDLTRLDLTTSILQTCLLDHCAIAVRIDCMAHLNYKTNIQLLIIVRTNTTENGSKINMSCALTVSSVCI